MDKGEKIMVTVLDCIERVPSIVEKILDTRKETTKDLFDFLGDRLGELDELVFIGSGTSNTSVWSSRIAVEKMAKMRVTTIVPNEFYYDRKLYNKNALYIFTSQSGNSILTRECMRDLKKAGYLTCGITEGPTTDIAKEAGVHVDMNCGYEEYGCRTIGYCASILTHMVIGLEIGLRTGRLSQEEYDAYIADAYKIPASHKEICKKTMAWYDANEARLADSDCYVIYGAASLWGVALEGALKIMEMAKKMAIGYELEDGLHGPTMAFDERICVIALDGGDQGSEKALGCGEMAKEESGKGFVMGGKGLDDTDLKFDVVTNDFRSLEFAPAVEILAYRLAGSVGVDLTAPFTPPKKEYFALHDM
jgi:glucosamine 6-phosphate synthetase-like amidotransferase/phosphosugar isomerase protein